MAYDVDVLWLPLAHRSVLESRLCSGRQGRGFPGRKRGLGRTSPQSFVLHMAVVQPWLASGGSVEGGEGVMSFSRSAFCEEVITHVHMQGELLLKTPEGPGRALVAMWFYSLFKFLMFV